MKTVALIVCFIFCLCSFGPPTHAPHGDCDHIPPLNKSVVDFVKTRLSKKVGRGECWDLAAEALNTVGANWDKAFGFGRPVDLKKECVYPGDIMQFEGVEVRYKKGNTFFVETMEHHTAIVYEVKARDKYILADQNNGTSGRKVGLTPLELPNITKGSYQVFRPVK